MWKPREHTAAHPLAVTAALSHPLQSIQKRKTVKKIKEKENEEEEDVYDPLGASTENDMDSFSLIQICDKRSLVNTLENDAIVPPEDPSLPNFKCWGDCRRRILSEFTVEEENKVIFERKEGMIIGGRAQFRPDLLSDVSAVHKLTHSSYTQLVSHMKDMNETLVFAWKNNKRIEALNLVAEMVRSICSVNPSNSFFPAQFVLVCEILDRFGRLVYERLLVKANEERHEMGQSNLQSTFNSSQVHEKTVATAKNWFIKVSEVKDPITALYLSICLSPCLRFIQSSSLTSQWIRLASSISSIQHPVVAAYTRAYLCKQAMYNDPCDRSVHWKVLNDWMQNLVSQPELKMIGASLEWIISCVSYGASSRDDLSPLWEYATHNDKRTFFVLPLLRSLPSSYLAANIVEACHIVCLNGNASGSELRALIVPLLNESSTQQSRSLVLRCVWKECRKLSSTRHFLEAASPIPSLVASHFSMHEVDVICNTICTRLSVNSSPYQSLIVHLITSLAQARPSSIPQFILLDSFHSLLSLIEDDDLSSQCASCILHSFISSHAVSSIDNVLVARQLLSLTIRLSPPNHSQSDEGHDALIVSVIDRVSLLDGEGTLNWLSDVRAAMFLRQSVMVHCITLAASLVLRLTSSPDWNAKCVVVTRCCLSFIHISLASLSSSQDRLHSTCRALHSAIAANALPQAEGLARIGVQCLLEMPLSSFPSSLSLLLPLFVLLPFTSPNRPFLFLFHSLVNVMEGMNWTGHEYSLCQSLSLCLNAISSLCLPSLPSFFSRTSTSQDLYRGNEEMKEALHSLSLTLIHKLKDLSKETSFFAIPLLEHIVMRCDPSDEAKDEVTSLMHFISKDAMGKKKLSNVIKMIRNDKRWKERIPI